MSFPKLWIAGLSAAAFAVAGTYLWREGIPSNVMKPAANAPPVRPAPVTAGMVKDQEFAISRVGLGTVQAYNTVTVRVRVDGEVQKITFGEGQDVHAIAPRAATRPMVAAERSRALREGSTGELFRHQFGLDALHRSMAAAHRPHRLPDRSATCEGQPDGVLERRVDPGPPEGLAGFLRPSEAGMDALPDHAALELRERPR
jgi:hypothetical protein